MLKVIAGVSVVVAIVALAVAVVALTSGGSEGSAPTKADRPAYTVAYVEEAVRRYEEDGLDATIAYYNSRESVDGQWYGIIIDENGYTIGHPREEIRGRDPNLRVDATGYFYGDDLRGATEDGRWVDYVFLNLATGREEIKHVWAVQRDGFIFASGWYERYISEPLTKSDPSGYTVAVVDQAIDRYEREGRDASIAYHNNPESVDGQWYVFVIDETGTMVAHPTRPDRIGTKESDWVDVNGYHYGPDLAAATEEGRWVNYWFTPPGSDENAQKHTWIVRHDGLLFGSGWYER